MPEKESVCWVGLVARKGCVGDLEIRSDVAAVKLDQAIESECCVGGRSPRLLLSLYQRGF